MLKGMTNVALRSVISLETSRHPLIQSYARLKPIVTWLLTRSRPSVFTLSSDWFSEICFFVLIGCSVYSDLVS